MKDAPDLQLPLSDSVLRGENNRRFTEGLFFEISYHRPDNAIFTTKPEGFYYKRLDRYLHSFPKLYIQYCKEDPTEYDFAMHVFGSWEHWKLIEKNTKLKECLSICRAEVDAHLKSKATKATLKELDEGGAKVIQAAKFAIEKGWIEDPVSKRKAKKEIDKSKTKETQMIEDDLERLGISSQQSVN